MNMEHLLNCSERNVRLARTAMHRAASLASGVLLVVGISAFAQQAEGEPKAVPAASAPSSSPSEPEIIAAARQGDAARVRQLVNSGVNANTAHRGITALMYAAYQGDLALVTYLIERGADVNHSSGNETPMFVADRNNFFSDRKSHPEVVAALVKAALTGKVGTGNAQGTKLKRVPTVDQIRTLIREEIGRKGLSAGGVGVELAQVLIENASTGTIRVYARVTTFNKVAAYILGTPDLDHFIITPAPAGKWTIQTHAKE